MVLNNLQFLGAFGWAEMRPLNISEKLINVFSMPCLVQQPLHIVRIGRAERPRDQRNNILIFSKNLGIVEITPSGLHHLPEQGTALCDGNGILDLPEKFPPFLAVHVFYDNNEVVCIKAVDFALKFDLHNGPAGKTGGVTAGEHQGDKRRLNMGFKMTTAATG